MGKIVLLDELTINQIAAGEVIERPASVVKEMLENSIDAGAKNITVEVKNGGISFIRITDDGCGISEDDMEIAFERHATSKIRSAGDLQKVKTMGFRGEALASISAIANVEMISKTESDDVGHKIVVEGGKILEKSEVGAVTGTRITVQNLFYNTPVRYKFLKKDYTEAGYIEDIVTRVALVNKGVSIKLINNGKVLLQTTGSTNTQNIIYSIYGKDIANGIKEVEYEYEDIKVTGVVGIPEIARSNRSNQLFFVNNRFVRDKNLTAGTEQAYKNLIPAGKFAFVILNLEMNPNEVDVNVHPAKLEVRFQDESKVFKAVYHAIKNTLGLDDSTYRIKSNELAFSESFSNQNTDTIITDQVKEQNFETKDNNESNIEEDNEKKGLGGLFKKFKKEKEDDEKENTLLEIFNARKQGLSKPLEFLKHDENTVPENIVENIVEEIPKVAISEPMILSENKDVFEKDKPLKEEDSKNENNNEDILKSENIEQQEEIAESDNIVKQKEITESEFSNEKKLEDKMKIANEDIAEKGVKLGDTLVSSNTRELDFNVMEMLKDKTLVMDSIDKIEKQETTSIPNTKSAVSSETQIIESVNKVPTLDAVEKITSKILEMKMNNLDSTQMIDTSKVREAISESQKITPEFANMYKKTFGLDANEIRKERALEEQEREKINVSSEFMSAENDSLFEKEKETKARINYKFVGIAFENYIIIEYKNEMFIIDEMSARERINVEKVKLNYYSSQKDSASLLLPDIVTCTFREMSIARENIELFRNAGFDFEEFGENTIKLTAVPTMCEELNTKTLFLNVLNEIGNIAINDIEEKEKKFISAVAVNSTVKPKLKLDEKEVDNIMQELLSIDDPFTAPQGKPTAIKISRGDIEKKFARRK